MESFNGGFTASSLRECSLAEFLKSVAADTIGSTMTNLAFRPYDPSRPLISLHVPKCEGTGLMDIFFALPADRFRYLPHYPDVGAQLPPDWNEPGVLIHGHSQRFKGQAIETICPGADQFIAIQRDPLDVLISSYYYGRRYGHSWAVDISIECYLNWWFEQPQGPLATALPACQQATTLDDYVSGFVCIGLMEHLPAFYQALGRILNIATTPPRMVNKTNYQFVGAGLRLRAEQSFAWDYALIERVRSYVT